MAVKDKIMVNWINGFKAGNKKEKYQLEFRLGTFTVLEIKVCFCASCDMKSCSRFRFMLLNLGFEI
jgi:hypothetical protein